MVKPRRSNHLGKMAHSARSDWQFPASAIGDDIEVYSDETREHVLQRYTICANKPSAEASFNLCLSDYNAQRQRLRIHRRFRRHRWHGH